MALADKLQNEDRNELQQEIERLRAIILTEIEQRGATKISLRQEVQDIKQESLKAQQKISENALQQLHRLETKTNSMLQALQEAQDKNEILHDNRIKLWNEQKNELEQLKEQIVHESLSGIEALAAEQDKVISKLENTMDTLQKSIVHTHNDFKASISKLAVKLEQRVNYSNTGALIKGQILVGILGGVFALLLAEGGKFLISFIG